MSEIMTALRTARAAGALTDISFHFADLLNRLDAKAADSVILVAAIVGEAAVSGQIRADLDEVAARPLFEGKAGAGFVAPPVERWKKELSESKVVGGETEKTPLVLSEGRYVYLRRYFDLEQRLAHLLFDFSKHPSAAADSPTVDEALELLFGSDPASEGQRLAARNALHHRFSIISGGPGTGKTAAVMRILTLLWQFSDVSPGRTLLCAPTGKAAARLRAAASAYLENTSTAEGFSPDALTIHRLLGWQPGGRFRYHKDRKLPCDLLVLDEASMVDISLLVHLLEALPHSARVILLGDRDQLASVEAGAVLGDICRAGDEMVWHGGLTPLTHHWRFGAGSAIATLAGAVREGKASIADDLLDAETDGQVCFVSLAPGEEIDALLAERVIPFYAEIQSQLQAGQSFANLFRLLEEVMVLCAHRYGPRGMVEINRKIMAVLAPGPMASEDDAYPGMPLMVTRNDPGLDLFNGDIGIVIRDGHSSSLHAVFPRAEGGVHSVSMRRLPEYQPAYAFTVHKAQGSQAQKVFFVLPETDSRVLTRELVYTGITRARTTVEVWGAREVLVPAVEKTAARPTGLVERLRSLRA